MKECKIVPIIGKNTTDYQEGINSMLRNGWRLMGSFGKNNMLLIFSRDVKVSEEED